ncbi:nonsense-mediated mRNA decay factor SMG7-like [Bidens hawaiensis]|uniref:nonsense-mediated mRNA decay factor SMG7-like n=1 Tax=Bidens hawaiensis TaxID=980011 RepID=UPI00404A1293
MLYLLFCRMDKQPLASSSHDLAQRLYDKNIELENKRRKSAQARVPSDPNAWHQMRENFETIILEDHAFSEKNTIEFALWQLHYRRIEEFRAHYTAASQPRGAPARPDRASKIRLQFKTFLSEATGFYHDLILKIRAKYGLPIGQFYPEQDNQQKDGKKSMQIKKGLISCHRCLIYLGDLARYKGLYGEGESKSRDYAAASSYYLQAASLWPSSGNPHHQLAILATYSGDELMAVYRYFRSLAAEHPFSTARDNLIVAFEKNRQSYTQLHVDSNGPVKELPVRTKGRGRGKADPISRSKELVTDTDVDIVAVTRQTFKAFRVSFVRLNGILFTHTSLEAFEEILSLVTNALQELLSSGPEDKPSFGTDADENGLFIVILVSILIFTVNNVRGGGEDQSYADIVQNTVLLKNALITFYEIIGQLLKRCIELIDPSSSFLLSGILVCVEWIACHSDIVISKETDEKSTAQIKFWGYCVSLFNKLLSAGLVSYDDDDDEDLSCFTDMTRYEEGENEYQSALWEDFELRGFLPLEPAHTFLDFSRKHSDNKKDKLARVKRILTAGKVIVDKITIDHKKVRFDSKLNKFVIDVEMKDMGSSKSQVVKQLTVESHVEGEGEDEDEVIVFKPNLIDNRAEMLSSKEMFEKLRSIDAGSGQSNIRQLDTVYVSSQSLLPVNNYTQNIGQPVNNSYSTQNTGQPVNNSYSMQNTGQPYPFQSPLWSSGLQGLALLENGQPEMHRDMQISNASAGMMYAGPSHTHEPDPYLVGRNTSLNMSTSSLKVSTNRPIRHLGPPPGFTSVRPSKQVNEPNSALGQNQSLLNDDYSWLDGYQLQSSMKSGVQPVNLPSSRSSQYANDSVATSSFPFPGKQVPVVQFEAETQNLDSLHAHRQQRYVPQLDQQGQSIWKGNHFV